MRLAELSDDQLVDEYKRRSGDGRDEVEEELFARNYGRVARWCYRMTNDRDAAADLAQEVFLKAHRALAGFKGHAQFSTWLYSIVRNEALNRIPRARPVIENDDDTLAEVVSLEAGPDELAERRDRARWLDGFLRSTLDGMERIVFTLHYGDEMPLDVISRLLRLDNASGAKAYIVSARRKLARAARRVRVRGEVL